MKLLCLLVCGLLWVGSNSQFNAQAMPELLKSNLEALLLEEVTIAADRKTELRELGKIIATNRGQDELVHVVFICTHNSRRSQLSELWLDIAANHYQIPGIRAYSGGTEATAFNHRMVAAVKRFGFPLEEIKEGENPVYQSGMSTEKEIFSKKYDDPVNPKQDFIAVMVCTDADRNCPVVPGAQERFSLPYVDPKKSDDTPTEGETYDAKVREIGREILFMMREIKAQQG